MSNSLPKTQGLPGTNEASLSSGVDRVHVNTATGYDSTTLPKKPGDAPSNFLQAPSSGPIRPLSPDTISNFSFDEYDQVHHDTFSRILDPIRDAAVSPSAWRHRLDVFWIRNKGLVCMLAAQFFGTLMNVTIRLLEVEGNGGKGFHPFQILFARMGITLALASSWMWWKKTPHFPFGMPEVRWLLVARGFAGFFGVFGMYYSLLYLPLADATVLTFLAPSLACWACSVLINEPFTRREQVAALISVVGVVLIARPTALFSLAGSASSTDPTRDTASANNTMNAGTQGVPDASNYDSVTPMQRLSAVGVAMLGVCGAATAYTTIRWIGKRAHPLISVNYFAAFSFVISIVAQLTFPGVGFLLPSSLKDWAYLLFLGACGFILQFLLATALSYEKSSRATNMTYTQMLFALAFDKIIFGNTPGWVSIIGSSLILGSAIFVAVQQSPPKTESVQTMGAAGDEESQQGLMSDMDEVPHELDARDTLPAQEIQPSALR